MTEHYWEVHYTMFYASAVGNIQMPGKFLVHGPYDSLTGVEAKRLAKSYDRGANDADELEVVVTEITKEQYMELVEKPYVKNY